MMAGNIDVVLNADTTGSMNPCAAYVRRHIEDTLSTLFKEVPGLRIGLGFNGDYCDRSTSYVTTWHPLTTKIYSLCQFVRNVGRTNGGDLPECYELVLNEAQTFKWDALAQKVFVLIADDVPHLPTDPQNRAYNGRGIDWREEADNLARMGIVVYAVQCLNKGQHADAFYHELAQRTRGYHLKLDQFEDIVDLVKAICYQQAGPDHLHRWESHLEHKGRMTRSMDLNLSTLSGRKISEKFARKPRDLAAVLPGRFQMLLVDHDVSIRQFVEENGLEFKKGRGFYQFTKAELIQEKKEVVLCDKLTGDMFTGEKAREMIGLRPSERARVKPAHLALYNMFVQSTSYNRKLIKGTMFLYEVNLER